MAVAGLHRLSAKTGISYVLAKEQKVQNYEQVCRGLRCNRYWHVYNTVCDKQCICATAGHTFRWHSRNVPKPTGTILSPQRKSRLLPGTTWLSLSASRVSELQRLLVSSRRIPWRRSDWRDHPKWLKPFRFSCCLLPEPLSVLSYV